GKFLVGYAKQLRIVVLAGEQYLRVPNALSLSENQWKLLSRHIFTGKPMGCLEETVAYRSNSGHGFDSPLLIELPGRSLGELVARFGISPQKPSGFDGRNFLFESITVEDASKLASCFPRTRLFSGRVLRVVGPRELGATNDRGMLTLNHWDRLPSYNLHQAADAGVVPPQGDIVVDWRLEWIFLPGDVQIA